MSTLEKVVQEKVNHGKKARLEILVSLFHFRRLIANITENFSKILSLHLTLGMLDTFHLFSTYGDKCGPSDYIDASFNCAVFLITVIAWMKMHGKWICMEAKLLSYESLEILGLGEGTFPEKCGHETFREELYSMDMKHYFTSMMPITGMMVISVLFLTVGPRLFYL
ncbi:uncharacterized protein LOC118438014 [Folsomia candida]|uniref:uncharacterized protein LOC118438014 n=1 Tax=Folsomia candida TaxID=158441 RepID=UPI001604ECFF|nr:uncharacterized protein LOC118438014 [Folsomia candida]